MRGVFVLAATGIYLGSVAPLMDSQGVQHNFVRLGYPSVSGSESSIQPPVAGV
jgi:hypothetical protein